MPELSSEHPVEPVCDRSVADWLARWPPSHHKWVGGGRAAVCSCMTKGGTVCVVVVVVVRTRRAAERALMFIDVCMYHECQ